MQPSEDLISTLGCNLGITPNLFAWALHTLETGLRRASQLWSSCCAKCVLVCFVLMKQGVDVSCQQETAQSSNPIVIKDEEEPSLVETSKVHQSVFPSANIIDSNPPNLEGTSSSDSDSTSGSEMEETTFEPSCNPLASLNLRPHLKGSTCGNIRRAGFFI